jgi:TPR repeat protein
MQSKYWIAAVLLTCGFISAFAQYAGAQIDAVLLQKANAGDPIAQVAVGDSYAAGKTVPQDLQQAVAWYRQAADKADIPAELRLAALYRDGGQGFDRDMVQAAAWYLKAADQGDVSAQSTMGTLYSFGQGVAQNYAEAYYWLDLAAAVKGPKQAQYAAYLQMMGAHITVDELAEVQSRAAKWKSTHPRPDPQQPQQPQQ